MTPFTLRLDGVGLDSAFINDPHHDLITSDDDAISDVKNKNVTKSNRNQTPTNSMASHSGQTLTNTVASHSGQTLTHDFKFRSVHPSLDNDENQTPFISTHHSMASCLVDYILVSRTDAKSIDAKNSDANSSHAKSTDANWRPAEIKCLSYQRLPNEAEMDRIGLLPNEYLGSDHLSLNAGFVIAINDD